MAICGALSAERYTRFLMALLEPRAGSGGWIKPAELAAEVGCSRATAYRLIAKAEAAGVPIIRDSEQGGAGQQSLGIRCLLVVARRPDDPLAEQRRPPSAMRKSVQGLRHDAKLRYG